MPDQFKTRAGLRTRRTRSVGGVWSLRLTIVFHPDLERVGCSVDLLVWPKGREPGRRSPVTLGRNEPVFDDGLPISEPHVNRKSLVVNVNSRVGSLEGLSVRLTAVEGSDCRIGAEEASDWVADAGQLRRGVPIRFGHGVVALLRLLTPKLDAGVIEPGRYLPDVLGASVEMDYTRSLMMASAATDLPVLLLGESGVGKDVAARAIHRASARCDRPMVAVNMAAIPESLAAAELFGSVKGAFTGAEARRGYFAEADSGTLFLDEIGDTPASIQVQLLRALEQGEIQVVGGRPRRVDVRLIAATDASVAVEDGFRHALHARLAGHRILIPPLRDRLEDVGPQALSILKQATAFRPLFVLDRGEPDPEAAAHWARFFFDMLLHDWPGNSRELRYTVLRAAGGDPEVVPERERRAGSPGASASEDVTDDQVEAAYRECGYEVAAAARYLGVSRGAMYRRLAAHPRCMLAQDLTDQRIRSELLAGGSVEDVAFRLGVSPQALRPRLKILRVDE